MWRIAARVERNRSGPSRHAYRLYALDGQPVKPNDPISCPVSERDNGRCFLLDVGMTKPGVRASYPYMLDKHTQQMQSVSLDEALAHVARNWPSKPK